MAERVSSRGEARIPSPERVHRARGVVPRSAPSGRRPGARRRGHRQGRAAPGGARAASEGVTFGDVRSIGGNPALLIPTWRRFVDANAGDRALWGVSEPLWPNAALRGRRVPPARSADQHGAGRRAALTLLCPFDGGAPGRGVTRPSTTTRRRTAGTPGERHLPPMSTPRRCCRSRSRPHPDAEAFPFTTPTCSSCGPGRAGWRRPGIRPGQVRRHRARGRRGGDEQPSPRRRDGARCVPGLEDGGGLVCEIRDAGRLSDPMVGRRRAARRPDRRPRPVDRQPAL